MLDTFRQGEKVGQPQILFRTSNFDPAEDYTISYQGLVSDFFAAGLVSAAVNLHYGRGATGFPDDAAFEVQYSPYGADSGLCTGVATTAVAGEKVTLEPCGVSSKTVWIVDSHVRTRTLPRQHGGEEKTHTLNYGTLTTPVGSRGGRAPACSGAKRGTTAPISIIFCRRG